MGECVDMICESEEEQGYRKLFMMSMTRKVLGTKTRTCS